MEAMPVECSYETNYIEEYVCY